ncbi:MAG: alpha/beta fold hydrolase [Rhodothermales bacterium]
MVKSTALRWFKYLFIVLGWMVSGVLALSAFVGMLWMTGGAFGGFPALIGAFVAAGLTLWWAVRRSHSVGGLLLRLAPTTLALLIVAWSMIPLAPDSLEPVSDRPGIERWTVGDGRVVAVSRHTLLDTVPDTLPDTVLDTLLDSVARRDRALLFVHGGPGAYVRDFDREFWAVFVREGFEVYTYDQVGAGLSDVVEVPAYTHEANVSDLAGVIDRIDLPVILIGQSYGAGVVASYLDQYYENGNGTISHVILIEPSPVPGMEPPEDHPHYAEKTTSSPSWPSPGPADLIDSPRFLLAMLLPADNQFVGQEELMNLVGPEKQDRIVAAAFCADDPVPDFENLRVNILANRTITDGFWTAKRPDLSGLDLPTLLLLGACSYVPRGFAMDYFDVLPIDRSHVIPGVGHVVWGDADGMRLTRQAILNFVDDRPPPLPNEPDVGSRVAFIDAGR